MNDKVTADDHLVSYSLDFDQRRRAERLIEEITRDPEVAAFEIIHLRDQLRRAVEKIEATIQSLGGF